MSYDFDLIVVGSGAGGGTFAYATAKAGKKVLLIERGKKYVAKEPVHDEQIMLIDKAPYDDRLIRVNDVAKQLYMGVSVHRPTAWLSVGRL
jgi:choline dehydrogenase-like flavoprotein